jgi:hypothetical protein
LPEPTCTPTERWRRAGPALSGSKGSAEAVAIELTVMRGYVLAVARRLENCLVQQRPRLDIAVHLRFRYFSSGSEFGAQAALSKLLSYIQMSGFVVAPGPSERCMMIESVHRPNLKPIAGR